MNETIDSKEIPFVWTRWHIEQACWYFIENPDKTTADGSTPFAWLNLTDANLTDANLTGANLERANLTGANLERANLTDANLTDANLERANLTDANLERANLTGANLTRVNGTQSAIDYLETNFEKTADGYIAYKTFGNHYAPNPDWKIESGSVLTEVVNPNRGTSCGCGVNVAKRDWNDFGHGTLWKVLIRWHWLPGVVVPFHTDGKIRCERVELVEIVRE